ncbi:Integrase core domain protein [Rhodobacteraceae bacterium THAF1]|nr:Integrase core domain protein [Palleronia sp. THAF1]VDC31471.1 Integrase core domain protein [Rhodobacteraceae bacterium THAF1]
MTASNAANVLGLSRRQVHRRLKTFQSDGPAAIRHKARGRALNNRIDPAVREVAVTLVRENYIDFGPTFAAEKLHEDHGLKVSRETLRKWMQDAGIWLSRKQRRTFHQPRLRRECFGELIQIDGSDHHWFEDRGPSCTLLVFIDDATSTLMHLEFLMSESTFSYFGALEDYLHEHGRPVAFCSDKHTVLRAAQQGAKCGHGMPQFGRALNELNIEILCANSSQAKGRVERANRTLQDRLVKELRLAGISDLKAANAFSRASRSVTMRSSPRPHAGRIIFTERSMSSRTAYGISCANATSAILGSSLPSPTTGAASFSSRTTSRARCLASVSTATSSPTASCG